MKWTKMRDGLAATGHDGVVYRIRRDPLRVEATTPDGEAIEPVQDDKTLWRDVEEAKWWCDEHNQWRQT